MAFGLDDVLGAALRIADKFIPDPAAKAAAVLEMSRMKQAGEFKEIDAALQTNQMQADINKVEAGSTSIFIGGWRPAVGWVCVIALGANFIALPALDWASAIQHWPAPQRLETGELMTLLLGMLGMGGLRTKEKLNGVAA